MRSLFLLFCLALPGVSAADPNESANSANAKTGEIPTTEHEFIASISDFDKNKIIEQFGEPSKQEDLKDERNGKIIGSVWHYHFINTSADGAYYETTELDLVDDKVVTVVFMNSDGSEPEESPDNLLSTIPEI